MNTLCTTLWETKPWLGFLAVHPGTAQGMIPLASSHPLAQSLCRSGHASYLRRSFANRCPDSSPGSVSEARCGSRGRSSLSGSPPGCGGWPWAEAGASLQGGTSPPALWGRGRAASEPSSWLPTLGSVAAAWFPHLPNAYPAHSCP